MSSIQMGNESNPNKPHYDITMSRRTRRLQSRTLFGEKVSALKEEEDQQVEVENEEEKRKNKLKEFFRVKEEEEEKECRSSLGERFTEEDKQHQLVVKHEKGLDGMNFKKMVSRCAKMWGNLIKIKGASRKKRVLQLTM